MARRHTLERACSGSLPFRERRAEAMWNEVYVRQNIGLVVSKSTSH